jgi:hypothetical protein
MILRLTAQLGIRTRQAFTLQFQLTTKSILNLALRELVLQQTKLVSAFDVCLCHNSFIPAGLPFPDDRDMLVDYLERGLSLRCLFPKLGSEKEGGIVCLGRLVLIGGIWKRTPTVCGVEEKTSENYQRHIKCIHLRVSRAPKASLALRTILECTLKVLLAIVSRH